MRRGVPIAAALLTVAFVGNRFTTVEGQGSVTSIAAVPSEKGGQDIFGAYEPVPSWPKPLTSLPNHGAWTWGAGQGVFAETPNHVFVLQRGELPFDVSHIRLKDVEFRAGVG